VSTFRIPPAAATAAARPNPETSTRVKRSCRSSHAVLPCQARILELAGGSLPAQLARLLLDEAIADRVALSQDTLAAMLGVHRPSLNKVLKELEYHGYVQLGYAEVLIRDRGGVCAGDHLVRVLSQRARGSASPNGHASLPCAVSRRQTAR
jgi:hypothetical protein